MSNKPIEKVKINSDLLLSILTAHKVSFRQLSLMTSYSDRTIREAVKEGEMSPQLVDQISRALLRDDWYEKSSADISEEVFNNPRSSLNKAEEMVKDAIITIFEACLDKDEKERLLRPMCYAHCYILESCEQLKKKGE